MGVDSGIAIAIMTILAAATAALVATRLYSNADQWTMLGLAVSAFGMVNFLLYGSGQLFWPRVIPVSAAIIYSNLAAAFADGLSPRAASRTGLGPADSNRHCFACQGRFSPRLVFGCATSPFDTHIPLFFERGAFAFSCEQIRFKILVETRRAGTFIAWHRPSMNGSRCETLG